jgi:tRNA dimethylallyltransferase
LVRQLPKICPVEAFNCRLFNLHELKNKNKKLVVVAGPTAVGKTALSIELAERLNTEIISADSRQMYRELTIGTAKPAKAELAKIKHHFIDSHSIKESYDAAQFGEDALRIIETLFLSKDYVVVCGGSGLYIKAICEGFDDIPEIPEEIRSSLVQEYEQHGLSWLQHKMQTLDPAHYAVMDQRNPHRLIRALEVVIGTGTSISAFQKKSKRDHGFEILKIGLELPRDILYQRIDARMDKMIHEGLFEEAKNLYTFREKNALQTVGYQEIFDYMDGKYDYEEAVRLLKRNSRRYAKRQLTWFKRDPEMVWFNSPDVASIEDHLIQS